MYHISDQTVLLQPTQHLLGPKGLETNSGHGLSGVSVVAIKRRQKEKNKVRKKKIK